MPVGYFLLVRRKGAVGAIRVTSATRSGTDGWFGTSSYESYFEADDTKSLSAIAAIRHSSALTFTETKGVHAVFLYGGGQHAALIGGWKFSFSNPVLLPMSNLTFWGGDMKDHGFEFAPTSACDIREVDVHDSRLRWYRHDRDDHISLPVAELPKRTDISTEK
jgi:hypothetical protein